MGPKWEYETRRRRESDMFAPAVVWAKCWGHSLSEDGRKEGEEFAMQAKFVPGGFFFVVCLFQVALGKAPGVYTQRSVYARWRLRDTWRSRGLAFLNSKRLCPLFFLKYSFRRAMLQLEFRESKSKPEESHFEQSQRHRRYAVCTVGGDDVWTLTSTTHETRISSRSTVAYFSSKVLSETRNAPTWV